MKTHNFANAQQINIQNYIEGFKSSPRTEAKNETATLGLTTTQKAALKGIADENGVGVSTMLGQIIEQYFDISPHLDIIHELTPHFQKIKDNKQLLQLLLNSLS